MGGPFALVRWCEDPPKWDVVNVKDIQKCDGGVGTVAEVKYKGQLFPAVILEYGKSEGYTKITVLPGSGDIIMCSVQYVCGGGCSPNWKKIHHFIKKYSLIW